MLQTLSMKKSLSTSTYSSQQQTAHWLQKRYYTKCSKRLPCFSRTLLICFHFFLQAHKKLKQSQAASKSAAYESILSQHASSALEKNKAARESQVSIKMYTSRIYSIFFNSLLFVVLSHLQKGTRSPAITRKNWRNILGRSLTKKRWGSGMNWDRQLLPWMKDWTVWIASFQWVSVPQFVRLLYLCCQMWLW